MADIITVIFAPSFIRNCIDSVYYSVRLVPVNKRNDSWSDEDRVYGLVNSDVRFGKNIL